MGTQNACLSPFRVIFWDGNENYDTKYFRWWPALVRNGGLL